MVSVEITIVTTEADPYGRYHGKTVDKSLDGSFWDTQEDAIIKMTGAGFTHTQTVELAEGSHYVIYGNSAATSYPWHVKIFVNGTLIAEGDVYRGIQLRGDFAVTETEPPVINAVTISAPSSAEKNTSFTISGTVKDQFGVGVGGASVALYDNGSHFATVSTNSAGVYSKSHSISSTGIHELAAVSGGKRAYTDITITTPEEPEPPIISNVTISAPASHVEDSPFAISGRVTDQYGDGMGGVTVGIYVNRSHITNATTESQGYYSRNVTITSPGVYELGAVSGTKSAYRSITITEAPAEPPVVTSVSIDAPASVDAGVAFTVSGYVLDQYNVGMGGVTVFLFDNGSHFATLTTNSAGGYSKSHSISLARVHELSAKADSKWAYRDITIVAPAPETYVVGVAMYDGATNEYIIGTLIIDGVRYTGERWKVLSQVEEGIHIFNVEPPAGYTFVEWQVHEYGGPLLYTSKARPLSVNIDRHIWIWAEVAKKAVGIPTTTTISAPSKAAVNEKFNISGILYETESGIPIPNQPINHSYNGKGLGSSTTGIDGDYLKEVSIPEADTWTLKSDFLGTETLQASRALVDAVVTATPIETALLIAGPIATALALFIYGTS